MKENAVCSRNSCFDASYRSELGFHELNAVSYISQIFFEELRQFGDFSIQRFLRFAAILQIQRHQQLIDFRFTWKKKGFLAVVCYLASAVLCVAGCVKFERTALGEEV